MSAEIRRGGAVMLRVGVIQNVDPDARPAYAASIGFRETPEALMHCHKITARECAELALELLRIALRGRL